MKFEFTEYTGRLSDGPFTWTLNSNGRGKTMGTANKQNYRHLSAKEKAEIMDDFLYGYADSVDKISKIINDFPVFALEGLRDAMIKIVKETKKRKCA